MCVFVWFGSSEVYYIISATNMVFHINDKLCILRNQSASMAHSILFFGSSSGLKQSSVGPKNFVGSCAFQILRKKFGRWNGLFGEGGQAGFLGWEKREGRERSYKRWLLSFNPVRDDMCLNFSSRKQFLFILLSADTRLYYILFAK